MSFSTPNFEIRREYQERLPRVRARTRNEDDEDLEAYSSREYNIHLVTIPEQAGSFLYTMRGERQKT